jgi:aquaporin related protein
VPRARAKAHVPDWIYWLGPALGAIIAAGFYKLLKWLQYETVLGPEDGDVPPPRSLAAPGAGADVGPNGARDEEKAVGGAGAGASAGPTMVVAGPGLGDLLTEGPQHAVSAEAATVDPVGE